MAIRLSLLTAIVENNPTRPASPAHAATNAIGAGLTILLFMGAQNWVFVGYTGILSWIPLGALCAWIILTGQLTPIKQC